MLQGLATDANCKISTLTNSALPDCYDDSHVLSEETDFTTVYRWHSEENRLNTFKNWPPEWGRQLAKSGFYSIHSGQSVRCTFCGLEIVPDVSSAHELLLQHWKSARHYCAFLQGQDVSNEPLDKEGEVSRQIGFTVMDADTYGLAGTTHSNPELSPVPVGMGISPTWSTPHEADKLILSGCPIQKLTSSQRPLSRLTSSERSTVKMASPECHSSITTSRHQPSTLQEKGVDQKPHQPLREQSSPSESHPTPIGISWAEIIRSARYPHMAAFQKRMDTLDAWPLVRPGPREMARAGLFCVPYPERLQSTMISDYQHHSSASHEVRGTSSPQKQKQTGSNRGGEHVHFDSVKCFWCGQHFHRWQPSDDPLLEHARLSPRCHYVTRLLGNQLHREIFLSSMAASEH